MMEPAFVNPPPRKKSARATINQYIPLVERVAKVEYRRIPSHMVDYEELVNIGAIAIQALMRGKSVEDADKLNTSYLATAIRWAIRNELRTRYKWYTLKHTQTVDEEGAGKPGSASASGAASEDEEGFSAGPEQVREAIYETILSIEGISEGADGESSYDFIKDDAATPEERLEITELGRAIKKAIEALPPKERTIMEYRFYRNMQVKDIATMVGLSSSRITRIVQASLNLVRDYLKDNEHID
ncbi:MAG: sigma-70 family RNA polymerase sigma factor [Vampirovibrionales bacterium]|nr:sigma-70 family RNA polymerase sigma factor [Vampirovibrionales bacterium]